MKHYSLKDGDKLDKAPLPDAYRDIMPIGKYKGLDIVDIPSSYLKWLCLQDWFEQKHRKLLAAIDDELKFRDKRNCHFEEDEGRRG